MCVISINVGAGVPDGPLGNVADSPAIYLWLPFYRRGVEDAAPYGKSPPYSKINLK